ncbi:hypothetical protein [Roseomonas rosulenta]|uniref:hypothetical protein n=1 Tax=Roseomonas rosulenta TaxID=2748667 RepID=UPI0018DF661F|nr:hypothetical protein [Roseomonas rosulenta]
MRRLASAAALILMMLAAGPAHAWERGPRATGWGHAPSWHHRQPPPRHWHRPAPSWHGWRHERPRYDWRQDRHGWGPRDRW